MKKAINARLNVKPESIEQFLNFAKVIVAASNLEPGCLVYNLYQEVGKPSNFIFYEVYINQEAIDFHNSTDHFKTFIGQITSILDGNPKIEIF